MASRLRRASERSSAQLASDLALTVFRFHVFETSTTNPCTLRIADQSSELKWLRRLWDHTRMSIRKEFVRLLASRVVEELLEQDMIAIPDGLNLTEPIFEVMEQEASLEDRINEEVRLLLNQYQDQMRSSGASYQEMFKLIKNK